jgi:hypothetical protein
MSSFRERGLRTSRALGVGNGNSAKNPNMMPDDFRGFGLGSMLKGCCSMCAWIYKRKAEIKFYGSGPGLGCTAPDTALHRLGDSAGFKLLSLASPDKLLVLNFGSCS